MSSWAQLRDLSLEVSGYELEGLSASVSSDFERRTTVVHLRGAGEEGIGEDVVYDAVDHELLQAAGPVLDLAGTHTLGSFCELIGSLELFPATPQRDVSYRYRRWTFDAAALDLALRQNGLALHEALGRDPQPVTFVVSLRLGEPPTIEPLARRLAITPTLRFKLDPTPSWSDELIAALVATGAVDSLDFKGHYSGTIVDVPADPQLYGRLLEAFPRAWIEDPHADPQIAALLEPHAGRLSWDAPIHGIADIEALPFEARMVNVKPSRLGGLRSLLDTYDYCAERGIGMYGGGQFELGPGRGQNQYLASLFHPDTPNDIAPTGYNLPEPAPGLPPSPLAPAPAATGFRWRSQ